MFKDMVENYVPFANGGSGKGTDGHSHHWQRTLCWVADATDNAPSRFMVDDRCVGKDLQNFSLMLSLWEDTKTGSKWAVVNRCYLPDDLPDVVVLPCTPGINEHVREGLIEGPCEVFSPNKFK
ncbi:hypothetical protein C5167_048281 [Papaver somniferum]|uniref:Uncharacterized protein n=1 Tax=Papaver somniferum TaxID=3469 RepID=A0A4Y7KKA6_PAPSO|nr:hypothetical protein C5167_048281 [Papaver somniferum]